MANTVELDKIYEAYDAGYQVFLEKWQVNREMALNLMKQNLKPQAPQVAVLSVGAGPGDFDVQVIHALKQHLPEELKLRYVAVEPNPLHRQRYEQKIRIPEFKNVDLEIHPQTIEDFQTPEKFDIIHYTHCLYHMPDHEKQIILQGMEMLKDNGFIIITLCTADAVIFETIFKYAALTGQGFAEMLQMEKMQAIIDELGLSYKLVNYPESLDISLCFEKNSSAGKALMDFFCQADSSILSDKQRSEILDVLVSNMNEQDGRKLVASNAATMIISK
ncbi:type 12 methyltransferase (plasmid) [Calothrix sp. NIES-4071]|nr:type 12 methyltransferase [Calothrix sp. NIES-4071]BAZ65008.1 type 12 methyltransferase [Calothrix sp. NIES-4105]